MKAMLVIATKNGYAVAPYTGDIPPDFVQNMAVSDKLRSDYSFSKDGAIGAMAEYFEPPKAADNVTPIKEAA